MSEQTYDIAIVGGGPGGYVAAIRAAQLGKKVAVIEREYLGGVCLNWGCIPTKALLRNAEIIRLLGRGKEFGFSVENPTADYTAAVERSRKISERLVKGVRILMDNNGIDVIWGTGKLASPNTVAVHSKEEGDRIVSAKDIILATGACPCVPPGFDVDGKHIINARHAIERTTLPETAILIGGGPIGLEIGTVWSAYGTKVEVVEMQSHILPTEDEEAAQELSRYLKRQKIKLHTSTRVEKIQRVGKSVHVEINDKKGTRTLEADVALVAVGFCGNCMDLGLRDVGVEQYGRGWVKTDDFMRSNIPHVYAIGDINGKLLLAHVASAQGILAVETIAGLHPEPFNLNLVPRCTYTTPQVASFGLSEAKAKEQGLEVRVSKFPFLPNGKALGLGENHGFVKIVAEESSGVIIGAVIVGPEATELLPELVLASQAELTPDEIAKTIHAHPTLSEAVAEAAHGVFGKAIHV